MRHSERFESTVGALLCRATPFALFLALTAGIAQAQDAQARQRAELASIPKGLPGVVLQQVQALGNRMTIPGKEESVFDGQLVDDAGRQKTIRVVHQLSGLVRIEDIHDKSVSTFDGDSTHGVKDRMDESLLDTFVMDSPEGMLYSLRNGASMVLLGRGFSPESHTSNADKEPRYDIYEVTAPVRSRRSSSPLERRYYFDSATGLLASTRYIDFNGVNVETRFLKWEKVDGSAYPGRVERYENGHLAFSFIIAASSSHPRRDAATFQ